MRYWIESMISLAAAAWSAMPVDLSERALQVLEGQEAAGGVEAHADGVEAELWRPRTLQSPVGQPLARHRPDLPLLSHADRRKRPEHLASRNPDDPRLHLAEDEKPRIPGDDVELPVPRPKVPLDHLEPTGLQMPRRQLLAASAQPATTIRHRAVRSQPPRSRRTRWPSASSLPRAARASAADRPGTRGIASPESHPAAASHPAR